MSKYTVFSLLILFRIPVLLSQNYYILSSKDSAPCQSVNYFNTNAQGKMVELDSVNMQNKTIKWEKNDIPEIYKISQDGVLYVKMPLKIDKLDAYYRYGKRVVSGKMIVDVLVDVQTSYRLKENFDGSFNQQGVMKKRRKEFTFVMSNFQLVRSMKFRD